MKRITKLYVSLASIVLLSACSKDFLSLNPETYVNAENFYRNESELKQAVNGSYSTLQGLGKINYWLFGEMRSDNTTYQNNTTDRGHEAREFIDQFLTSATAEPISQFWQASYQGISRSNEVLNKMEGVALADNIKKQYIGEVKFLRAFHYFNLVRQFGGVPLKKVATSSPDLALSQGRATIADTYAFIIEDLSEAVEGLKGIRYAAQDQGRVTEGAARALLGKVYLTLKQYDKAVEQLKVVTNLGYSLHADYMKNFAPGSKNGVESIFEIQYLGSNPALASDFMYRFAPYNSGFVITQDPSVQLAVESGWNIPTKDLIESYENGDIRKSASLAERFTNANQQVVNVPYIKKFNHGFVTSWQTDVNFPILRYADVLLMLAEGLNELAFSPSGEASIYLNAVRRRAGLSDKTTTSQQEFRAAIMQERRVELAFENHRWYDLVRWGTAIEVMKAHGVREKARGTYIPANAYIITNNNLLLPIPQKEVNLDKLTQNPL